MSNFLKDLFSVGLSKGGIIIFSIGQNVIIARTLGPELNGILAALVVYPSLFMAIGSLGVRQSTAYFIAKQTYTEDQVKTAVSQIWFLSSIFSLVSCFFLIRYFSNAGFDLSLVLLALAPIPFTLFNIYNSGVFLGKNQIQAFNKIDWMPSFFVFILTTILVFFLDFSIQGAMIALIAGPAVMSFIMVFKNQFLQAFSLKIETKVVKSLISLGLIYAIALLVIYLNYKLDVILIDKLSSSFETGIYSKGSGIIQYLWEIPMLLSTIIFARSANSKDNKSFSIKVCQLLRLSIIIIAAASIILAILAPQIITLLFGEEFFKSAAVLRLLVPGVLLMTVFKVLNMDMAGRGKPWISLKAMIPALILNIGLNYLWIPSYGANGAAIASTISYSVAAILFLIVYSKEAKISISEIVTYKKTDFAFLEILYNGLIHKNVLKK